MTDAERAFIRGFAAAVAEMQRHHVNAEDLLNDINATERLLRSAHVDEYDLVELRPALRRLTARRRKGLLKRKRKARLDPSDLSGWRIPTHRPTNKFW